MITTQLELKNNFENLKNCFKQLNVCSEFTKTSQERTKESKYFQNDYTRSINCEQDLINEINEIIENINYYFEDNGIDEYLKINVKKCTSEKVEKILEIIKKYI